jgi:L-ribulose-5-phosphate 3-epimerase UlaE
MIKHKLYNALILKYEAERTEAEANLINYFNNSVGVAEHNNIIESMDILIEKLANAEDKLQTLKEYFNELNNY